MPDRDLSEIARIICITGSSTSLAGRLHSVLPRRPKPQLAIQKLGRFSISRLSHV